MERPTLRDWVEIQRAHDILHAVASREVDLQLPPDFHVVMIACHDLLSWVLNGPCGAPFARNLQMLEELAAARGYKLERIP